MVPAAKTGAEVAVTEAHIQDTDDLGLKLASTIPLGRLGEPDEVADAVLSQYIDRLPPCQSRTPPDLENWVFFVCSVRIERVRDWPGPRRRRWFEMMYNLADESILQCDAYANGMKRKGSCAETGF